jgi:hypothetical protein
VPLLAEPNAPANVLEVCAAVLPRLDQSRVERCVCFSTVEASERTDNRERGVKGLAARETVQRLRRTASGESRRFGRHTPGIGLLPAELHVTFGQTARDRRLIQCLRHAHLRCRGLP